MNVPYFVRVLVVSIGWIIGGFGFYLGWAHSLFRVDVVFFAISALIAVLLYVVAVSTTLTFLGWTKQ